MITILAYHQIAGILADRDPKNLSVSPIKFEKQMEYLHLHGFCTISLVETVGQIPKGFSKQKLL
jgi:hypothetical protein